MITPRSETLLIIGAAGQIFREIIPLISGFDRIILVDMVSQKKILDRLSADLVISRITVSVITLNDLGIDSIDLMLDYIEGETLISSLLYGSSFTGSSLGVGEYSSQEIYNVNCWAFEIMVRSLIAGRFPLERVVAISSIYGKYPIKPSLYLGTTMINPIAYGASKASLNQTIRYLSAEYGNLGVRVNGISLGGIYRGQPESFVKKYSENTCLKRMAEASDLLGPVNFLLSEDSSYVSGQMLEVDGGWFG